jgi:hypothetical protein
MQHERLPFETEYYPEVITLNEPFQIFSLADTHSREEEDYYEFPVYSFDAIKILETGKTPPIPIGIHAADYDIPAHVLTPFTPELGVLPRTDKAEVRREKTLFQPTIHSGDNWRFAPLSLYLNSLHAYDIATILQNLERENNALYALTDTFNAWFRENREATHIATSLRFQLVAPFAYEAHVNTAVLEDSQLFEEPELFFDLFTPLPPDADETATVPNGRQNTSKRVPHAYPMNLPHNILDLMQLQGRFLLDE